MIKCIHYNVVILNYRWRYMTSDGTTFYRLSELIESFESRRVIDVVRFECQSEEISIRFYLLRHVLYYLIIYSLIYRYFIINIYCWIPFITSRNVNDVFT